MSEADPAVPIRVDPPPLSSSTGSGPDPPDPKNSIELREPITGYRTYIQLTATSPEERLKEIKERIRTHRKICDDNIGVLTANILGMELKDEVRCAMQRTKEGCEDNRCQWSDAGRRGRCTYNTRQHDAERTRLKLKGNRSPDETKSLQRLEVIHRMQPQVEGQLEELVQWCERIPGQLEYLVGQLDKFRKREIPLNDELQRDTYELEQLALYTTYRLVSNTVEVLKEGKATMQRYIDEIETYDKNIIQNLETLAKEINRERAAATPGVKELGLILLDMDRFVKSVDKAIAKYQELGSITKITSIKEWEVKKVSRRLDLAGPRGLAGMVSDATQWARGASTGPQYTTLHGAGYFRSFRSPKGQRRRHASKQPVPRGRGRGTKRRRRGI